jgi:hypothetical protein
MKSLYFAYGANTNLAAMARRCPKAKPLGMTSVKDYRLVFRGVADVEPCKGSILFGALWEITPQCERSLDAFEGFPTLYEKMYGVMPIKGVQQEIMIYTMTDPHGRGTGKPPATYEQTLREGYAHFGIPEYQIDEAIAAVNGDYQRPSKWSTRHPRRNFALI